MNMSDWYYVRVDFATEHFNPSYHHVLKKDLMLFVRATYKLHVNPGRNPHNLNDATPVSAIYAYDMDKMHSGGCWWTGPGLGVKGRDSRQATVLHIRNEYKTWLFYKALHKRGIDPFGKKTCSGVLTS